MKSYRRRISIYTYHTFWKVKGISRWSKVHSRKARGWHKTTAQRLSRSVFIYHCEYRNGTFMEDPTHLQRCPWAQLALRDGISLHEVATRHGLRINGYSRSDPGWARSVVHSSAPNIWDMITPSNAHYGILYRRVPLERCNPHSSLSATLIPGPFSPHIHYPCTTHS